MKIAMFTDSYRPQINGLVTSIDLFAEELRRKGHEVLIVAPAIPNYRDKDRNIRRIKSVVFSGYKEYRIALPFKLLIDSKLNDIDLIHVHSPFSIGLTGMLLSRHNNIPCVATFHTMFNEYSHYIIGNSFSNSKRFKRFFSDVSWRYIRWFYNGADKVVAPSNQTKNILRRNGIKKKIAVIPTGMRVAKKDKSREALRKKHGFGNEKILLHVGRITKEKNIGFIVNSLKNHLSKDCKLVITSDGPFRKNLEELTKSLGLQDKVIFTGYLKDEILREYYGLADVFVMASETETQGIVLLEAAQHGLPSVVLEAPVTADFVREHGTGIVATKRNFSNAVSILEKKRGKYVANCAKTSDLYSIERCANMLLSAYQDATSNS